jgi:hypothetical protein
VPVADARIVGAVIAAAAERGLEIGADDVVVDELGGEAVPAGWTAFRAWFSFEDMREAVTGLLAGDEVETVPMIAAQRLLSAWGEGDLPPVRARAEVLAALLGGSGRHVVALDQASAAEVGAGRSDVDVRSPEEVEGGGVAFWWKSRVGLQRVEVVPGQGPLAQVREEDHG